MINFLAMLSRASFGGFLYFVNNTLTNVRTISFLADSVKNFSSIHCSTSGRQCSGTRISLMLETDEPIVETTEPVVEDELPGVLTGGDWSCKLANCYHKNNNNGYYIYIYIKKKLLQ